MERQTLMDPLPLLLMLGTAYMCLLSDFVIAKQTYKRIRSMQGGSTWMRSITVTQDEIVVNDGNTATRFLIANVTRVKEDDAKLRVFIKSNGSIRLYKNAFTKGTWQECLSLLAK